MSIVRLMVPLILLAFHCVACRSFMTPLEADIHYEYRQFSEPLLSKIANSQKRVKERPELIKDSNTRERFLNASPENHGGKICAVTTYYLLLKYSGATALGSFEDYYIDQIARGNITETTEPRSRRGFAYVRGSSAAGKLVGTYLVNGCGVRLEKAEGGPKGYCLVGSDGKREALFKAVTPIQSLHILFATIVA